MITLSQKRNQSTTNQQSPYIRAVLKELERRGREQLGPILPCWHCDYNSKQRVMEPVNLKLVIVGDGVVGKTCLLSTYAHNAFPTEYVPTIFDNTTSTIKVDQTIVNLSLWDTAGQEEYARLRPLAYPSADIFLIIFSVVDPDSFVNARKKWFPEVTEANATAVKCFVGNKIDLRSNAETVPGISTKETARKAFQEEMSCKYYECSALTRVGVVDVFEGSVREALARRNKKKDKLDQRPNREKNADVCCQLI